MQPAQAEPLQQAGLSFGAETDHPAMPAQVYRVGQPHGVLPQRKQRTRVTVAEHDAVTGLRSRRIDRLLDAIRGHGGGRVDAPPAKPWDPYLGQAWASD